VFVDPKEDICKNCKMLRSRLYRLKRIYIDDPSFNANKNWVMIEFSNPQIFFFCLKKFCQHYDDMIELGMIKPDDLTTDTTKYYYHKDN
jgi:hypothetical protein